MVPCLNKTRIRLRSHSTDYIHASYVPSVQSPHRFIITQGPLESTIVDFWKMVIQEKVERIIMVCDFMEENRKKCAQYYPCSKDFVMEFVNFKIYNENVSEDGMEEKYLKSDLVIKHQSQVHRLQHFKFSGWPDGNIPKSANTILMLLEQVQSSK